MAPKRLVLKVYLASTVEVIDEAEALQAEGDELFKQKKWANVAKK
jgi:hypothetical protein